MGIGKKFKSGMLSIAFGMAGGAAIWTATSMSSVLLLEDFSDHMRARGMDPEIAQGLSDQKIYVRSGANNNLLYDIMRLENLFSGGEEWPHMRISFTDALLSRCRLYVHEIDMRVMAAKIIGTTPDKIRQISPELNKAFNDFVLLHEARHCHSETRGLEENTAEADADYHALAALENTENGQELAAAVRHMRALSFMWTWSHDTAMILDAQRHDRTPPIEEEIIGVMNDAKRRIFSRGVEACYYSGLPVPELTELVLEKAIPGSMKQTEFLPRMMQSIYDEEELKPLLKRRVGLYLAAVRYFSPEIAADMRSGSPEKWICPPKGP